MAAITARLAASRVSGSIASRRCMSYDVSFHGLRAVVTGGTKGIGRATSIALAELGADVVAVGRSGFEALEHDKITGLKCDMSDLKATTAAFNDIGDVDLLVNNAGIAYLAPFLEHDMDEFQRVMDVNVTATAIISKACAKSMVAKGRGAIVNVSSQASQVGLQDHTAYCVSKGALDQLTRMMAVELGPKKIRVNSVNPTVVLTDMGRKAWSDPVKAAPMLARIPLGRFAEEQDVVDAILYLLSARAAMVHGAILPVDGGFWTT